MQASCPSLTQITPFLPFVFRDYNLVYNLHPMLMSNVFVFTQVESGWDDESWEDFNWHLFPTVSVYLKFYFWKSNHVRKILFLAQIVCAFEFRTQGSLAAFSCWVREPEDQIVQILFSKNCGFLQQNFQTKRKWTALRFWFHVFKRKKIFIVQDQWIYACLSQT